MRSMADIDRPEVHLPLGILLCVVGLVAPGALTQHSESMGSPAGDTGKIIVIAYLGALWVARKTVWLCIPLGLLLTLRGALLLRRRARRR